jgi:hypothetical protein
VGVVQSKLTGKLRVIAGKETRIVAAKGEEFLVHTHPVGSSKPSDFHLDIQNSSSKVEAVIDMGGNITHFNNTGILKNPSTSPINELGYIVGHKK